VKLVVSAYIDLNNKDRALANTYYYYYYYYYYHCYY